MSIIYTKISAIFLIVAVQAVFANFAAAQSFSLSGEVYSIEGQAEAPLTGVNVRLLALPDSTMAGGATTGEEGTFTIRNIAPGEYLLSVSYIGFETMEKPVEVSGSNIEGLAFRLQTIALELGEFQVTARRPRVDVRGDTTAFHADGYRTNPDASAEDLVRRMPGFTIENGRVQAQGEEVRRVLVDGEEFFGDDAAITLRNLPAEMIEQIEVFNRMSDQGRFMGFDDGEGERTVNIVTRSGMSNGQFGRANSGLGSETRYTAGGNYNYFEGQQRISILGLSNNINQQNFSSEDLLGVSQGSGGGRGGGRGRGGRGGGGNARDFMVGGQNGISSVHSSGINYIDRWSDSWSINSSYFFNMSDNINDQNRERRYLTGFSADQVYGEDAYDTSDNFNHRFNMRLEHTFDERRSLIITPRMSFQQNNNTSLLEGLTMDDEIRLLNQINSENRSGTRGYDISNSILYRHRFETDRRTFSANFRTDFNDRTGDRFQYDESLYFGEIENSIVNNQQTEVFTGGYTVSADFSFTEPVGNSGQLMFSYQPSVNRNNSVQDAFLFNEESGRYDIPDQALSNRYDNTVTTHRTRGSYRLRGERYNAEVNLSWQHTGLDGEQVFPEMVKTSQNWQNLLPGASFQYRFDNTSNLRFNYNTGTRTPSARQLQNVVDNSNPLRMSTGNAALSQQYDHRFTLRYRAADGERGSSTMAFISMGYTRDYIGNRTFIARSDTLLQDGIVLGRGARLITPDNIGDSWDARSYIFRSIPVDRIRSNLNLNGGISYSRTPSFIDQSRNLTDNIGLNAGTTVSSNISEHVDFHFSYRANYNIVENSTNPEADNNYYIGRAGGSFNLMPWRGFVFASDLNIQHYAGLGDDFSQNNYFWNGSVGYKFLENRAAEIRLTVFDILAQNNNISRSISEDYIEDYRSNVLSRYMLMTFTYNFRSFSGRG